MTDSHRSQLHGDGYLEAVVMPGEDLDAIVGRTRKRLSAAGEWPPPGEGPARWDIPRSIQNAIWEDMGSGAYARAVEEAILDLEMGPE